MMGKICFVCGLIKPANDFCTPKRKKKGLVSLCQNCDTERRRLFKRVPVLMRIEPYGGLLLKTSETLQLSEVDQRFDQCRHYMTCLNTCSMKGSRDGGSWFCSPIVTTDPLEKANKYKTILDSFFMGKRTIPPPQSKFVTEHPEPCR